MFQIKKDNKVGKPDLIRARLLKANGLFAASDEGKSLLPSPLGSTNILVQASNYLTALVENSPNMSMGDKDVMRMFISICEFGDPTQILTVKQLVLALVPHAAPSLENLKNMKFWKEHFLLLSQVFDIQKNCFKDGGEAKLKKLIDEKAAIASMSIDWSKEKFIFGYSHWWGTRIFFFNTRVFGCSAGYACEYRDSKDTYHGNTAVVHADVGVVHYFGIKNAGGFVHKPHKSFDVHGFCEIVCV